MGGVGTEIKTPCVGVIKEVSCSSITPTPVHFARAQVDKAAEYLEKAAALDERDGVLYDIRVRRSDGAASSRGIYLREPLDSRCPVTCTVDVRPTVHEVRQTRGTVHLKSPEHVAVCWPTLHPVAARFLQIAQYDMSVHITLNGCCRKLSLAAG